MPAFVEAIVPFADRLSGGRARGVPEAPAMARILGSLTLVTAWLLAVWALLPHTRTADLAVMLAVNAVPLAGVLVLLFGRLADRAPAVLHAVLAGQATLVSLDVVLAGLVTPEVAFLYVCFVAWAFCLVSRRAAIGHTAWVAVCCAAALALTAQGHGPALAAELPRLLGVWVSSVVSVALVGALVWALASAHRLQQRQTRPAGRAAEGAQLHDPLTGLPNGALLRDRLEQALRRRTRAHSDMAVIVVEIDGIAAGDGAPDQPADRDLTAEIGSRLRTTVRPADTVGQTGAGQLVVVCEDLRDGAADAVVLARRILQAVSRAARLEGEMRAVAASAGIAVATTRDVTADGLLRDAGAALREAKARGPGHYELFDDLVRARAARSVRTERSLRQAIEQGELRLHYQPIVASDGDELLAVEALVRWQHPVRGLLSPGEFMDVAEDSGLVVPLGRWVMREACRQAAAWQAARPDRAPLGVTVNVSGRHVAAGTLLEDVRSAADGLPLAPNSITLEVTENGIMDREEARRVLGAARGDDRFRIALDDFGTGLSSLARLRDLPLDVLKLDRSFMAGLESDPRTASILGAVVSMADTLDLHVVAEGVESEDQLAALRAVGCPSVQGHYTGHPMPPSAIDRLLGAGPVLAAA